jgi:hypothetical protein
MEKLQFLPLSGLNGRSLAVQSVTSRCADYATAAHRLNKSDVEIKGAGKLNEIREGTICDDGDEVESCTLQKPRKETK